jgi:hypothetical protein
LSVDRLVLGDGLDLQLRRQRVEIEHSELAYRPNC